MFFETYKATLKNLFRSALIWITIIIVLLLIMNRVAKVNYGYVVVEGNQVVNQVVDTDPEFKLDYDRYVQMIMNATRNWIMLYAVPIFCVISTMIVLNRDYVDGFFEIEKSLGKKASNHFLGQLVAIVSVNATVCLVCSFISVHSYYYSRGGVEGLSNAEYLLESTLRVLRLFGFAMIPAILYFTGFVYLFCTIFKNGFVGAVMGIGLVLLDYSSKTILRGRFSGIFHDYISPKPDKLYQYWGYYDTDKFYDKVFANPFSNCQMILAIVSILVFTICYLIISYMIIRKREI